MKITKLIREYVTEQVSKVYNAKRNPYSEQAEKDKQLIEDFEEELRNQQRRLIEKFISENELYERSWGGAIKPKEVCTSIPSFCCTVTRAMINEKEWNDENVKAKNAKIREILLSLELGANREELNLMIEELIKSED